MPAPVRPIFSWRNRAGLWVRARASQGLASAPPWARWPSVKSASRSEPTHPQSARTTVRRARPSTDAERPRAGLYALRLLRMAMAALVGDIPGGEPWVDGVQEELHPTRVLRGMLQEIRQHAE